MNESLKEISTVWHEIFAGVYFCGLAIFLCLAGTNLCDKDSLVFLAGKRTQYPALIIFSFCNRNTYRVARNRGVHTHSCIMGNQGKMAGN